MSHSPRNRTRQLLVVDDDQQILTLILRLLSESEWQVTTCSSETRCIEVLAQEPPDAMILDMHMPCVSGYEILEEASTISDLRGIRLFVWSSVQPPEWAWRPYERFGAIFLCKDELSEPGHLIECLGRS